MFFLPFNLFLQGLNGKILGKQKLLREILFAWGRNKNKWRTMECQSLKEKKPCGCWRSCLRYLSDFQGCICKFFPLSLQSPFTSASVLAARRRQSESSPDHLSNCFFNSEKPLMLTSGASILGFKARICIEFCHYIMPILFPGWRKYWIIFPLCMSIDIT